MDPDKQMAGGGGAGGLQNKHVHGPSLAGASLSTGTGSIYTVTVGGGGGYARDQEVTRCICGRYASGSNSPLYPHNRWNWWRHLVEVQVNNRVLCRSVKRWFRWWWRTILNTHLYWKYINITWCKSRFCWRICFCT